MSTVQPNAGLTDNGHAYRDAIPSIAERYMIDEGIVRLLEKQLRTTCATGCEFEIAELGGKGSWSPGHVTGAPGADHSLRMRIDGLCSELAAMIRGIDSSATQALSADPHAAPVGSRLDLAAGESWWPASFGTPQASGEQAGVRFAFFPAHKRLLVQKGAHIEVFETGELAIKGVADEQVRPSSVTFDSDRGAVGLDELKCVPLG